MPRANGRRNPGPPKAPRETHASERLWKVSPPWKPAAKPARYHRGLEAFGFHTSRNPDGGFTYKPLTRGVGSFYVVKASSRPKLQHNRSYWSRDWFLDCVPKEKRSRDKEQISVVWHQLEKQLNEEAQHASLGPRRENQARSGTDSVP